MRSYKWIIKSWTRWLVSFWMTACPKTSHSASYRGYSERGGDLVAGVADELSDEELGYLVRHTLVKIVDEQYETEPFQE